jgi:hypothetical protein
MQTLLFPDFQSSRVTRLTPHNRIETQICGCCGRLFALIPPAVFLRDAGDYTAFYQCGKCAAESGYFNNLFAEGVG